MNFSKNIIFSVISGIKGRSILPTGRINESISTVRCGYVNFFIFSSGEAHVCIDTGFKMNHVKKELDKIGIRPEHVKLVLLTHSDYDHYGCMNLFPEADICMSSEEKDMINKGMHRPFGVRRETPLLRQMRTVREGDVLFIGKTEIRCILTPGHTEGSMSFLINGKYLFAGDTCRITDSSIMTLSDFTNMDTVLQKDSIRRLKSIPGIEMTFTGHYGWKYGF